MQSFRTEIENPVVEKDIIELEKKIRLFQEGKVDEERFRSLRLARGVYGQRQPGVQMIRIKIPYGRLTARKLRRIATVADTYSTGKLHITTRQDIQIHYVKLEDSPQLWAELEKDEVTLREACGNTVRNVTASELAGIDPEEPFDVSPYADAFFKYFLRNPVCQEMGRKFKVSFSSSDQDQAFSFMHDLGFIPKIKNGQRGFKVMIGGGLGAQPIHAQVASEFLPEDQIIPFAESILRIFDRYGERAKRFKARFKFLLNKVGLEEVFRLVEEEKEALPYHSYPIAAEDFPFPVLPSYSERESVEIDDLELYDSWLKSNVFEQKQAGFFGVKVKVHLGDFSTDTARELSDIIEELSGDDFRLSINQGMVLRFVRKEDLPILYTKLKGLNFADPGYDSTADITACPGTDTCNLGISSSTGVSKVLESLIKEKYSSLIYNTDLKIKISGCMNACGQHSIAAIGFHGSTLKVKDKVAPAMQVLLGGGIIGNGDAAFAQKVIKLPSKRIPTALSYVIEDYEDHKEEEERFYQYFQRQGKKYFYQLLKPLAQTQTLTQEDFLDWGHEESFVAEIGVGECAGVVIDLVATLLFESEEKLDRAKENLQSGQFANAIYHAYAAGVNAAKATLVQHQISTNTLAKIVEDFEEQFVESEKINFKQSFRSFIYQAKKEKPTQEFAANFVLEVQDFLHLIQEFSLAKYE
ncbi:MAG: nitrite/sulfite reductase [Bacteroidota bacterium]